MWIEIRIKYLLWFWNNFSKSEVFDCDGLKHWLHGIGNIYSLDISTEGQMMNGDIIIIISSYFCDNRYEQGSWTSILKDLFTLVNDLHVFSRLCLLFIHLNMFLFLLPGHSFLVCISDEEFNFIGMRKTHLKCRAV